MASASSRGKLTRAQLHKMSGRRAMRERQLRRDNVHLFPHLSGLRLALYGMLAAWWSYLKVPKGKSDSVNVAGVSFSRVWRRVAEQRECDIYVSWPGFSSPLRSLDAIRRVVAGLPGSSRLLQLSAKSMLPPLLMTAVRRRIAELNNFLLRHMSGACPLPPPHALRSFRFADTQSTPCCAELFKPHYRAGFRAGGLLRVSTTRTNAGFKPRRDGVHYVAHNHHDQTVLLIDLYKAYSFLEIFVYEAFCEIVMLFYPGYIDRHCNLELSVMENIEECVVPKHVDRHNVAAQVSIVFGSFEGLVLRMWLPDGREVDVDTCAGAPTCPRHASPKPAPQYASLSPNPGLAACSQARPLHLRRSLPSPAGQG